MASPRCLVLGANGFIGSHVVDALAELGCFVRCFDRYKTDDIIFANKQHHDIEIYRGDFLSRTSLEEALDGIEYVFHFISTTNPIISENDPMIDIDTNIRMSVELFEACAEKGIKKIIFASTGGTIYGNVDTNEPISEKTCPKPVSPYAIGKLTIENYLRYFKRKHSLNYVVLRISNPYGPRQNTLAGQGVILTFLEKIKNGLPIMVYGDGSMVRDYIYIEDVARMIVGSFEKDNQADVYNIGAGDGSSINDIVTIIESVTGVKPTTEHKPTPSTFVQSIVLDSSLFTSEFSIKPTTPLKEGIYKTWQTLQKK